MKNNPTIYIYVCVYAIATELITFLFQVEYSNQIRALIMENFATCSAVIFSYITKRNIANDAECFDVPHTQDTARI